jgi:hypothetical protein
MKNKTDPFQETETTQKKDTISTKKFISRWQAGPPP